MTDRQCYAIVFALLCIAGASLGSTLAAIIWMLMAVYAVTRSESKWNQPLRRRERQP